jgi:sRNA-binding carbon storage regulator CsrA
MSDELKVVISLKGDKASVGIQAPECDPVFFALKAT